MPENGETADDVPKISFFYILFWKRFPIMHHFAKVKVKIKRWMHFLVTLAVFTPRRSANTSKADS